MTAASGRSAGLLVALVPVVIGSLMFPINRYVVTHGFLPLAFVAPRFMVGTVALVVLAAARQWPWRMSRADALRIAVLGGGGICLNQISLVMAARYTTATTVALFFGTYPVWVALLSQLTRATDVTRRTLAATLVSTAGVAIVVAGHGGSVTLGGLGVAFSLLTPLTFAIYTVAMAPILARRSALQVNAIACLVATVPLFAVASGQLGRQDWSAVTALDWAAVVYAGLIGFVGGFGVMLVAVRLVGPTRMSLLMNAQAFLGVVFSVVLLAESISLVQIVGGAVIALSIALAWRSSSSSALAAVEAPAVPGAAER